MDCIENALSCVLPPLTLFDGSDLPPSGETQTQPQDNSAQQTPSNNTEQDESSQQTQSSTDRTIDHNAAEEQSPVTDEEQASEPSHDVSDEVDDSESKNTDDEAQTDDVETQESQSQTTESEPMEEESAVVVTIIDERVADYQQLSTEALERGDKVITLDEEDSISDITEELIEFEEEIDTINIIAHSNQFGEMTIGGDTLKPQSYELHSDEFVTWGALLSEQADIVLYSCYTASSESGQEMLDQIAQDTGADVAASIDATAANLIDVNTNTDLEYTNGQIEAANIMLNTGWAGSLVTYIINVDTTSMVVDGDTSSANALNNDTSNLEISLMEAIIAANNTVGATIINLQAETYTLNSVAPGSFLHSHKGLPTILDGKDITINGMGSYSTIIERDTTASEFAIFGLGLNTNDKAILRLNNLGVSNGLWTETGTAVSLPNVKGLANGAAVSVTHDSELFVNNVIFSNNESAGTGGAIGFNDNAGGEILFSEFLFNQASAGGAIFDSGNGDVTISYSFFEENVATGQTQTGNGGAIHFGDEGDHKFSDLAFNFNSATAQGGGIYIEPNNVSYFSTIENITLTGNEAETGSAISIIQPVASLNPIKIELENINAEHNTANKPNGSTLHFDGVVPIEIDSGMIANNLGSGIGITNIHGDGAVTVNQDVLIEQNKHGLGIDLGEDGITFNDYKDGDSGPNDNLNYGQISFITTNIDGNDDPVETIIFANYYGLPNHTLDLYFYGTKTQDPSGYGEGGIFLGSIKITTDANGKALINTTLKTTIPSDTYITMRAMDANIGTSEFSESVLNNRAPVAINDANDGCYDIQTGQTLNVTAADGLLANYSDPDGDWIYVMTFFDTASANHGLVMLNFDGSFSYIPPLLYTGPDSITYTISDLFGGKVTATVDICVSNTPPVANPDPGPSADDCYQVSHGFEQIVSSANGVLANDSDAGGDALSVINSGQHTTEQGGTIILNADGSFRYTAPENYVGFDRFDYIVSDGLNESNATITWCIESTPQELSTSPVPEVIIPVIRPVISPVENNQPVLANRNHMVEDINDKSITVREPEKEDPENIHITALVRELDELLAAQTDALVSTHISEQVKLIEDEIDLEGIDNSMDELDVDDVANSVANLNEFNTLKRIDAQIRAQIGTAI